MVRARVVNPKWIGAMRRHGYKGAFEMAATLDYLFAFAATTGMVEDHHFDAVHAAFMEDESVLEFLERKNPRRPARDGRALPGGGGAGTLEATVELRAAHPARHRGRTLRPSAPG